jgi:hypothetical protein
MIVIKDTGIPSYVSRDSTNWLRFDLLPTTARQAMSCAPDAPRGLEERDIEVVLVPAEPDARGVTIMVEAIEVVQPEDSQFLDPDKLAAALRMTLRDYVLSTLAAPRCIIVQTRTRAGTGEDIWRKPVV